MVKPKLKTRKAFDYNECAKYIGYNLGYDLRDVLGKYSSGNDNAEYLDFWHFVIACNDGIHNGCEIRMPELDKDDEEWQKIILKAFYKEFGKNATYWVGW